MGLELTHLQRGKQGVPEHQGLGLNPWWAGAGWVGASGVLLSALDTSVVTLRGWVLRFLCTGLKYTVHKSGHFILFYFIFYLFFYFFGFLPFLGLLLGHKEVPRLGVESEL